MTQKKGFQKAVNLSHAKMTLMERVKRDAVINKYSIGHVCHTRFIYFFLKKEFVSKYHATALFLKPFPQNSWVLINIIRVDLHFCRHSSISEHWNNLITKSFQNNSYEGRIGSYHPTVYFPVVGGGFFCLVLLLSFLIKLCWGGAILMAPAAWFADSRVYRNVMHFHIHDFFFDLINFTASLYGSL